MSISALRAFLRGPIVALALIGFSTPAASQDPAPPPSPFKVSANAGLPASATTPGGIGQLAWLAGCWEFTTGDRTVEEQWMSPRGNSMMGMSRTVRTGRLVAWETVLLRVDSTGAVSYHAFPGGQPPAVFPVAEMSDSHVVLVNPDHDFPQRIIYRLRGDTLAARVEGTIGGRARGSDFPYLKTRCSGSGVAGVTDGQGFTE